MVNREKVIQEIADLFPIDSDFPTTNATGKRLLMEAIEECGWKDLPDNILMLYLEKCRAREENGR